MNEMCLQELVHVQENMTQMPPTHQPLQPSVKPGIDSTTEITALGPDQQQQQQQVQQAQQQQHPQQQQAANAVSAVRRTPSAGQSDESLQVMSEVSFTQKYIAGCDYFFSVGINLLSRELVNATVSFWDKK